MKRIIKIVATLAFTTALVIASAMPAFADSQKVQFNNHQGQGGNNNSSTNQTCQVGQNLISGDTSDNQNNGACSKSGL
jgi:hypothetical protein